MKRLIAIILICLLLASVSASAESDRSLYDIITGNHPDSNTDPVNMESAAEPPSRATDTTVMVYMCGSTLESGRSPCASADLEEMISVKFDEDKINVVVMAGGCKKWSNPQIIDGTTGIYQISAERIYSLSNDGKLYNMGDPGTLKSFLQYAHDNFPSDHYALILWDHGSGSLGGICNDSNFGNDCITMPELDAALKESPFSARPLDWIGFDACLMSAAETAKIVAPYAKYMVASEESEPGTGWNYSFLKDIDKDTSPADTGKRIADSYLEACKYWESKGHNLGNTTMSCVDLSKISGVVSALDNYFGSIEISKDNYAQISRIRRNTVSYGRDNSDSKPNQDFDLVDLGNLVQNLKQAGIQSGAIEISNALSSSVVYTVSANNDSTGLSVYFPFYNKDFYPSFIRNYSSLNFSSGYESFITSFGNNLISNGNNPWNSLITQMDGAHKDNRTVFTLLLNEEQLTEIGIAEIVALQKADTADAYHLVATQDAVIDEAGSLSGEYVHTNLFVTGADGNPIKDHDIPLVYTRQDDGSYLIQVVLVDKDQARYNARLRCTRDEVTYQVTVEEVYLYDDAINGYSPRLTADLDNYVSVIYQVADKKRTAGSNGTLLAFSDWETVGTSDYIWNLDEPWQLAFIKDYLDPGSLSVAFKITDIFNNVYLSEPINVVQAGLGSVPVTTTYDDLKMIVIENTNYKIAEDGKTATLSARLKNISDVEAIVVVDNVCVDGIGVQSSTEVYGNGVNYGLLPNETQGMALKLPLTDQSSLKEVLLDLILVDSEDNEIGTVPVTFHISVGE